MPFANEPFRGTRRVPSVHNLRTDRVSRRWWWRHARCRSGSEYARALGFRADLCSPHHPHVRQRPGRSASVHPARRQRHGRGWTGRDPFPTREQGDSCHLETSGDLRDAMHWHLASRWHALGLPHSSGTTLPPPWSRAGREDGQDLANMIPDGPLLSLTIRLLNRERQRGLFPGSPFQLSALKVKFCKTKAERKPSSSPQVGEQVSSRPSAPTSERQRSELRCTGAAPAEACRTEWRPPRSLVRRPETREQPAMMVLHTEGSCSAQLLRQAGLCDGALDPPHVSLCDEVLIPRPCSSEGGDSLRA